MALPHHRLQMVHDDEPGITREWAAPPGWLGTPSHVHREADERLEVLDGSLVVVLEGHIRTYRAGEIVIVPAGIPHSLTPLEGEGVRLRWRLHPTRSRGNR